MKEKSSLPKGFLLMDTNCLLNYIEGKPSKAFNYQKVNGHVRDHRWVVLITPYTLWESIQRCTEVNYIRERREKLLKSEIWVVNVDGILSDTYSFVSVADCLKEICFSSETLHEYSKKRSEFRRKVYEVLYPKMITIAQIIAFIYLTITERKDDGIYPEGFDYRLGAVMNYFKNHPNLKVTLTIFLEKTQGLSYFGKDGTLQKPLDAKDYLKDELDEIIKMIIAISKVLEENRSGINPYDSDGEFNKRIITECSRIESDGSYRREDMVKCYKEFLKVESRRTADEIVDEIFMKGPEILLYMYKKLVTDWFTNGTGKQLINTIIDYSNMDFLFSPGVNNWVYLTEENKIVKALFSTSDEACDATRKFYKKFYLGKV